MPKSNVQVVRSVNVQAQEVARKVAEMIQRAGYTLADWEGHPKPWSGTITPKNVGENSIGILKTNDGQRRFGTVKQHLLRTPLKLFVGVFNVLNSRTATPDHPELEVNGEVHLKEMTKFAEKVSRDMGIPVTVILRNKDEKFEFFYT